MKNFFIKFVFVFVLVILFFSFKATVVHAATRTWDGGGSTNSWDECANWDGPDLCPTSADAVVFSATSTKASTVTVGSNFLGTITSLSINSGYTGTITQASPLVVTGLMSQTAAGSTYTAAAQTLSVGAAFTLNNATAVFTASSVTTTFSSTFTITAGIFNHNFGTVTFNGGTATLSCNNVTFNLVTFNNTNTKTISSNCNLPLGANPVLLDHNITLNGTFSGSGTVNYSPSNSGRTFALNSGASLVGFSAFVSTGIVTVSGATLDLGLYSPVTFFSFNLSSGSFTAPTGTMTVTQTFNLTGGTFTANGGTLNINGAGSVTVCNNTIFNLVTFTHPSGSRTIGSNCSLPLGTNPTVGNGGSITLNGTLSGSGLYTSVGALTLNSSASLSGFNGLVIGGIVVAGATADFSSYSILTGITTNSTVSSGTLSLPPVTSLRGFTISGGTVNAPSGTLTITGGGFTLTSGTFNHNNGTVVLSNPSGQTLTGSITYYNLTKTETSAASLFFTPGATQTILGTLTIQGINGGKISLRSLTPGTQWNINAQGSRSLSNLDVQDSNNINTTPMTAVFSNDSGNNTNWLFSNTSISFFLDYPGGNSHITNSRPTFRWKKATASVNSSIVKYQLWVDNGDTGDFNIDNIVPFVTDVNSNNKTLEFNRYQLRDDGDFLNLTTKSSNLWPSSMNNGLLTTGKKNWRIVAFDSAGNIQENSVDFWVDSSDPLTTGPVTNTNSNIILTNQSDEITTETNLPVSEPSATFTPSPVVITPGSFQNFITNFKWLGILIILLLPLLFLLWKRRK